jgi:hypothetical protein
MNREDLLLDYEDLVGYRCDKFNSRDWKEFEEFISDSKTYTKKEVDALIESREKEFRERIDEISKSNDNIGSWGDGFEYAMQLIYKELK